MVHFITSLNLNWEISRLQDTIEISSAKHKPETHS